MAGADGSEAVITTPQMSVLDEALERLVARRGVRHAVMAVESGDRSLTWAGAAGQAEPGGAPMQPDTPFHYASVTKLYTATAVMQLWEQGSVDLDAAITAYLPAALTDGLHRLDGVDRSDQVTVRHLLAHTSGLPDYFLDTSKGQPSLTDRITQADFAFGIDDVVARVRRLPAHFPPQDPAAARQRARYCDTNFQLLGAIVAAVTGRPFQDTVAAQILGPLGLDDTWFAGHPRGASAGTPAALWSDDTILDRPQTMASIAPDGGLIGTAADALAFLRALLGGALFQREDTLGYMQARWNRFALPRDRAAIMAPGWPVEYGLGIKRYRLPRLLNAGRRSPTFLGHTGASGSWLFWCAEHDLYLAGTVDQTRAAPVPYRLLPRLVRRLAN
ncbi:MAG TPA: serine hydrolase domain-containing protein [Egibacteraceae bacterium]|nr:serine hydrolase domain-containing protein [Egibacteraceae bacterium]